MRRSTGTWKGRSYRDRIFDYLEQRYMPGLRSQLVTSRIFTPHDFRDQLNAHVGSAFSLEPLLTQSAWFRPHNRDAELANLYLVGAGTHPGAGVPGVIGSAKATAGLMLKEMRGSKGMSERCLTMPPTPSKSARRASRQRQSCSTRPPGAAC
jgi:phytoene dehydrogenase-like protein